MCDVLRLVCCLCTVVRKLKHNRELVHYPFISITNQIEYCSFCAEIM